MLAADREGGQRLPSPASTKPVPKLDDKAYKGPGWAKAPPVPGRR